MQDIKQILARPRNAGYAVLAWTRVVRSDFRLGDYGAAGKKMGSLSAVGGNRK
jgi:hypothetical protein